MEQVKGYKQDNEGVIMSIILIAFWYCYIINIFFIILYNFQKNKYQLKIII
jgi:hypothetical protein